MAVLNATAAHKEYIRHDMVAVLTYRLRSLLLACTLLCAAQAQALDLFVTYPEGMDTNHQKVVSNFLTTLERETHAKLTYVAPTAAAKITATDSALVVLGSDALDVVLQGTGRIPTIAVFVAPDSYRSLLELHGGDSRTRALSAAFAEPDPLRQMALAKELYGGNARTLIVTANNDAATQKKWAMFARAIDLPLGVFVVNAQTTEKDVVAQSTLNVSIIIEKDAAAHSRIDLGRLLADTYDINQQGVIGFSGAIIDAGGLATTYATDNELATDINSTLLQLVSAKTLIPPHYTREFKVRVNPFLLRSLNLKDVGERELIERIQNKIEQNTKRGGEFP
jgi:hypothetical protein